MRILITGGAGYIGSNTSRLFHKKGYQVEVLDNLSTGNDWAIKSFRHHMIDILDKNSLERVFTENNFDAVIHFAGKSLVAESIKKINKSEYLAILVTNQPMIAKGKLSFLELKKIHNKLRLF